MHSYKTILMLARTFSTLLIAGILLSSCSNHTADVAVNDTIRLEGHPGWIMEGNIYEVNVRQYTAEGTFAAFAKHLDRLKAMGVQTLWFMPINPISKTERKGSLGSYYAVADYTAVNPEFGTMADWKALVQQAHEKGFKVMIDWVPNHTGADHYWLQKHPDFYVKDSKGNPVSQFDWTDTRKLNFANAELRDTMMQQMKFWFTETGIDGMRCDYAVGPSRQFWKECIHELKSIPGKNIFMLAEADSAWLHETGFDATYGWPEFNMMKLVAAGKRKASAIDSVIAKNDSTLAPNALRLYFTSNHDENSWNKADFETMPGAVHAPFAVLTQTLKRSVPLIYSGQEEPVLRAIKFFDKDSMGFTKYERAPFYTQLLSLRKNNPALVANASFTRLHGNADDAVYAFIREAGKRKVLVILNLSGTTQHFSFSAPSLAGKAKEWFTGKEETFGATVSDDVLAWGYRVYSY
jgi:glycosidase